MAPSWFKIVSIVALLWNLLGCAAVGADVYSAMNPPTEAEVAALSPEEKAQFDLMNKLSEARTPLFLGATILGVVGGAIGSIGLLLGKQWAIYPLIASLAGVVVQDLGFISVWNLISKAVPAALVLQGLVLLIAIGLVLLAWHGTKRRWLT
jgi:hypothetical protein